jgi:ferredoxin
MADDSTTSQDLVRELLVRELETVNAYTAMVESARTPGVRALIAEIAAQEKHHIAEAMDLLARYDAGQAAALARAGVAVRREPAAAPAAAPGGATLVFEPSGVAAEAGPDETLLAVALRENVEISHVCGGKGVCGTCRLEVLEGAEGLSGVTDPERKHLAELLGSGWRLACQAKASAPARFRVPPVKDEGEDEA